MTFLRLLVGENVIIDRDSLNRRKTVMTTTKKIADQGQMGLRSTWKDPLIF